RRARGGEPDPRQRDHRHGRDPGTAGRQRAGAEGGHAPAAAVPDGGPGARPRAAALHPGDHHQRRAPRPGQRAQPPVHAGARGGAAGGPRRRARRRRLHRRQRPARDARAPGRLWRRGGGRDRAGAGLHPAPEAAPGRHPRYRGPGGGARRPVRIDNGGTMTSTGHPADPGRPIRVCLVDDQTLVRQGIRSLLALDGGLEVVGEAVDGRQAVELIPQAAPDVVLLDMRMPVMSGLEALQALSAAGTLSPNIILTTFDDAQLMLAGLHAGAKGYLLKDVSLEQLVGAIRTVAGGGSLVQPAVTQRLLSGLEHMRNDFVSLDRPDPLTDRETEILRLMASGFSNKEIANSLGVAEGTIKNHVSNILSKLGVRDRTRAVLKAFELQLV